jgi:iron complex outermembrane receptor protein
LQGFLGWYGLITRRETLATETVGRATQDADITARDYALRLTGTRTVGGWRVQGGLDLNGRTVLEALDVVTEYDPSGRETSSTTQPMIEDATRRDWASFATADGRILHRLTGSLGARVDYVTTQNEGGFFGEEDTSATALSGFGSLTYVMGVGWTLTGQVGSGFRDPTLSDRYSRGITGRGFITGNPDLDPERSLQYDFALRHAGRIRSALYAYRYEIHDLVERYRSDGRNFLFRNRGTARIRGLELEAQFDVRWGLSLELTAQAAQGEALHDDAALDDVPSEALSLALHKRIGQGAAMLRTVFRARDDAPGPNEIVTAASGVVDASLMWRWQPHVEMRLALGNLLDADYRRSPDDQATRAPGRSAVLTLAASF